MILSDNETRIDLLNNEAIALTIIGMLRERPDHPVTIGVHGDWGAGKSSVLEMIEHNFKNHEEILCLKFNGWRFQGFEDAKIALIEGIVTGFLEKTPALAKAVDQANSLFRRISWLKVAKKAGGLAFNAFAGLPTPNQVDGIITGLGDLLENPGNSISKEIIDKTLKAAKEFIKKSEKPTSVPQEVKAFRKAFDDLLNKAGIGQLVVLIDDLDRCLPDTAIETLEAVRLFVFTSRTAFIVAADEAMIEYAVRKHFPNLPDTTGPQSYARSYLEKLIQVPFRIPALGVTETRIYTTLLLVGSELGETDPSFGSLIDAARERLRKPWTSGALDAQLVKSALGSKANKAKNALALSDQIGPILASGTRGNPRQIKRFLNTLLLRELIAKARGFGDEINRPILAKLLLVERFLPTIFEKIAAAAAATPDGRCAEIKELECHLKEKRRKNNSKKDTENVEKANEKTKKIKIDEWLTSPTARAWAEIQPQIGEVDLRPYLFVAKERKDFFDSATVLGQLAVVAEQLLGPKLTVQNLESELMRLALPEAEQLFEVVRSRIVGTDSFKKEPSGVAGLTVLVKAHPSLQGNLLDFLESLPLEEMGPWVCSGWDKVIKEAHNAQRYSRLLETWAESGNTILKATAENVLRTRRKS